VFDPASPCDAEVPHEPAVRGCGSLVGRAMLGTAVGAGLGAAVSHGVGQPTGEGAALGGALGLVVCSAVGVFLWATFPYKPPG